MSINLKKEKFAIIDNAFSVLKEDANNNAARKMIEDSLSDCFNLRFIINTILPLNDEPLFIMSVFPEVSTMEKIITAVSSDSDKKYKEIQALWEQNKTWTIEIDQRIIKNSEIELTNKELTALLLHEVGHVIYSNSITSRISTILQYELAVANMKNKAIVKNNIFKKILVFPILNACVMDSKKSDALKKEIKADTFVKKMGYTDELLSVMKKIINSNLYRKNARKSIDENMTDTSKFMFDNIDMLRKRQANLVKNNFLSLKKECYSPYIESIISDFYNTLFEGSEDSSVTDEKKMMFIEKKIEEITSDEVMIEAFLFGKKQLKRVEPDEIDYIEIKINEIKNESDRMMLITYIHSKIDIVEYYLSILADPKLSKKYIIPHSIDQLTNIKKRLYYLRSATLKYKIPERSKSILVAWPSGYEG